MCDVDVSTPLEEATRLLEALARGAGVAIGSRDIPGARVEAPDHRKRIGRLLNILVQRLTGLRLRDTQCGFS